MFRKVFKALRLSCHPVWRRALLTHRVAATTEHEAAILSTAPASLLDVGANKGQFALATRALHPSTVIHAFEPLPFAADRFAGVFADDAQVTLHRYAIAAEEGSATFHVASRDDCSSLLALAESQQQAYSVSETGTVEVQKRRLASLVDLAALPRPVLLKIDVQGGELEVLKGIDDFAAIDYIYVELSFVELYRDQPLFDDVYTYLTAREYRLAGIYNVSFTRAFGMTQLDGLFAHKSSGKLP